MSMVEMALVVALWAVWVFGLVVFLIGLADLRGRGRRGTPDPRKPVATNR